MARRAPRMASKVRRIRCSRAWVSTWMVTSSGIMPCSTSWRQKSKSVSEAEGKPTSISLKPMRHSSSNMRRLRSGPMGSTSAWLPSRRSTEHQTGALSMTLPGQIRSVRPTGSKPWYLWIGMVDMETSPVWRGGEAPGPQVGRRSALFRLSRLSLGESGRGLLACRAPDRGCHMRRAAVARPWPGVLGHRAPKQKQTDNGVRHVHRAGTGKGGGGGGQGVR